VGARDVYLLSIGATAASLAVAAVLLGRTMAGELPKGAAPDAATGASPRAQARSWTLGALALLATSITTMMMTNLDILMIGALTPPEEVGRYRAASRGVDVILIATGVAIQVMGPMLARALSGGHAGEARGLITRAAGTMAAVGLPICLALAIWAEFYLGLFGEAFVPAATAMRILVAGQVIAILCGPAGMALIMMRRERLVLWLNLAALTANLALNLALIPRYGLEGAALATLVSVAAVKIAMAVALRRVGHDPTVAAPIRAAWRRRGSWK
jgi:O-antigen/teichoic acid export membrane protein